MARAHVQSRCDSLPVTRLEPGWSPAQPTTIHPGSRPTPRRADRGSPPQRAVVDGTDLGDVRPDAGLVGRDAVRVTPRV